MQNLLVCEGYSLTRSDHPLLSDMQRILVGVRQPQCTAISSKLRFSNSVHAGLTDHYGVENGFRTTLFLQDTSKIAQKRKAICHSGDLTLRFSNHACGEAAFTR